MHRYQGMTGSPPSTAAIDETDGTASSWPAGRHPRDEAVPRRVAGVHDRDEFITAVMQHTPALLRVTASLVGLDDAQDAAQEAILRAWQARGSLRDPRALRPWLLRIAVNVCREWRRGRFGQHQRYDHPWPAAGTDELLATMETDPGGPDRTLLLDLRVAINALDADLRLALVLTYFGGMDSAEIGAALGSPASTIRSRVRRALTIVRDRLRDSSYHRAVRAGEEDEHGS